MNGAAWAYAQARLQARLGRRPQAAAWQAVDSSRGAAHAVAQARAGALGHWVEGLDEAADAHAIERHLRERWQREVNDVARWCPERWRPALHCFGRVPALALDSEDSYEQVLVRWQTDWRQSLPAGARSQGALQRPVQWLLPRLAGGPPRSAAASDRTQQLLLRLLRRHSGSAVSAFAYLALVALDLERLRGALVVRALLAQPWLTPAEAV